MESNGHKNSMSNRVESPSSTGGTGRVVKSSRSRSYPFYTVISVLLLICVVAGVFYQRHQREIQLASATRSMVTPSVLVVHPEVESGETQVILPGTVQAFMETPIYARVDGYLKSWLIDIGGNVKEGQLLAEIETPEVDQQLAQALAAQAQAEVDLKLAGSTAERWKTMLASHTVSQQEFDEKNSDWQSKQANLNAALANVKRLLDLQSFQKVYAPFDGIVTARNVDVGNLINAGSGSTSKELFRVAQTNVLRVYVNVPEYLSPTVTVGTTASIDFASAPGEKVVGKLVRTSGSIDKNSLTLLVELDVDNPTGRLLPGGYVQVHFNVVPSNPPLTVPANTLIFRSAGAQVGVVNVDTGVVHLVNIRIGRDYGTKLEVVEGLKKEDSVIINPSDSLVDGDKVVIHQ